MVSEPQAFAHPDSDHQHVLGHRECHLWCSASCVSSGDLKAAPRQPVLELTNAKWGFSGWMIWWRPRSTKLYLSQTVVKKEKIFGGFWAPNQALIHGVLSGTSKETTTITSLHRDKIWQDHKEPRAWECWAQWNISICASLGAMLLHPDRTVRWRVLWCCGAVADHVMISIVNQVKKVLPPLSLWQHLGDKPVYKGPLPALKQHKTTSLHTAKHMDCRLRKAPKHHHISPKWVKFGLVSLARLKTTKHFSSVEGSTCPVCASARSLEKRRLDKIHSNAGYG